MNGNKYVGRFKENLREDPDGKFYYSDEKLAYEGPFVQDKKTGKNCKKYFKNGARYEGEILNDKIHGFGKLFYPNGKLEYEGWFKENLKHGVAQNTYIYQDKRKYVGDF